jgi:hypothetical protein
LGNEEGQVMGSGLSEYVPREKILELKPIFNLVEFCTYKAELLLSFCLRRKSCVWKRIVEVHVGSAP